MVALELATIMRNPKTIRRASAVPAEADYCQRFVQVASRSGATRIDVDVRETVARMVGKRLPYRDLGRRGSYGSARRIVKPRASTFLFT